MIKIGNKTLSSGFVDIKGLTKIMKDSDTVWEKSSDSSIYSGGATLDGIYSGTQIEGYFNYTSPRGQPYNPSFDEYLTPIMIKGSEALIRCEAEAGMTYSVDAFSVLVDFTRYSVLHVTVQHGYDVGSGFVQDPYIQILDNYADTAHFSDGTLAWTGSDTIDFEIDVSSVSGSKYLRLLGMMEVTAIWLS